MSDYKEQSKKAMRRGVSKKSLVSKSDFEDFSQQLEAALLREVQRRKQLELSESMFVDNISNRERIFSESTQIEHKSSFRDQQQQQQKSQPKQQHIRRLPLKTYAEDNDNEQVINEVSKQLAQLDIQQINITKQLQQKKPQKQQLQQEIVLKKYKKYAKRSILRKIDHLLPQAFLNKTDTCKHNHGCFENVLRKALKNFLIGFFLQTILRNFACLTDPRRFVQMMQNGSSLLDGTRFGLFLMCFNTVYKLILCLMRRTGSKDKVNAPVAGFVSALSLAIDSKHRRRLITMLTISRIFDFVNSFGRKDKVKSDNQSFPYRDWILLLGANMLLISALGLYQSIWSESLKKFFINWFQLTTNDKILVNVWQRMYADGVPSF